MAGVAASLTLVGCSDDFLEVTNPSGEPLEDYYTTDAHIQEAVAAAYDPIHWPDWGLGQYNALNIDAEIMGDLFWVGGSNLDDMRNWHMLSNFQADENNTLSSLWTVDYSGIKRSNDLLLYLTYDLKDVTPENKTLYEMQGRSLRVFYYNMLWHYFGNIPYYLTNLTAPYTAPQISADEVYNNLIVELEEIAAAKVLPMRWDDKNSGRISQAMVYMMYAEMVMYQNDESRFGKALDYMNEIIGSGKYALVPDFASIWEETGEWSSESIWEINYNDDNNERGWGSPLAIGGTVMPTLISPNSWPGGDGWNAGADGWGFLPVRTATYEMFDENDVRRDATCWDVRGTEYTNRYQDTHIWLKKYRPQSANNADAGFDNNLNYNNNLRYYRYAECLLNAAELSVRTGKSGDSFLNQVRNRAGLGNATATIDNIIEERKLEFVGEGKRYWDLVRMEGVAGATVKASNTLVPADSDGTNPSDQGRVGTWSVNKKYIPIAQGELDSDPALVQNTAYFTK